MFEILVYFAMWMAETLVFGIAAHVVVLPCVSSLFQFLNRIYKFE